MSGDTFFYYPDPEAPGWHRWGPSDTSLFNHLLGPMWVRAEGEGRARVRIHPPGHLGNVLNAVHGGALLAFVDMCLFAGTRAMGIVNSGDAVTLDLNAQFLARGRLNIPLDADVELMRESGRFLFLRGALEQEGERVLTFSGIVRKPSARS